MTHVAANSLKSIGINVRPTRLGERGAGFSLTTLIETLIILWSTYKQYKHWLQLVRSSYYAIRNAISQRIAHEVSAHRPKAMLVLRLLNSEADLTPYQPFETSKLIVGLDTISREALKALTATYPHFNYDVDLSVTLERYNSRLSVSFPSQVSDLTRNRLLRNCLVFLPIRNCDTNFSLAKWGLIRRRDTLRPTQSPGFKPVKNRSRSYYLVFSRKVLRDYLAPTIYKSVLAQRERTTP
jgi:hypothetical protein